MKTVPTSSIPPLQSDSGEWAKDPIDKANLLASTLLGESRLPVVKVHRYSRINCGSTGMAGFLPIRPRHAEAILRKLDESNATGPDGLAARVLKRCCKALALPVAMLCRSALDFGSWPESWRLHWLFPLHKRNARSKPKNYRFIHLTAQISKVIEMMIANHLVPYLDKAVHLAHTNLHT